MEITYSLTHKQLRRRFAPPMPLHERFTLLLPLALSMFACTVSYICGIGKLVILELLAALFGMACLLQIMLWVYQIYSGRTNKSTTYTAEISELGFFEKASDTSGQRHPWTDLGNIADAGDYFMFTSNKRQHIGVIPKSAFDDENHFQAFFQQAHLYWERSKQKQQEEMQKAEGSWPPAPRPGA